MKKLLFLFTIGLLKFSLPSIAQDPSDIARVYFTKAESAFAGGQNTDALKYVKLTEENLGTSNSKILRLKIAILNQLSVQEAAYLNELDMVLEVFFATVDKTKIDESVYLDILGVQIDTKDRLKAIEENSQQTQTQLSRPKAKQIYFEPKVPKITITRQVQGMNNCDDIKAMTSTHDMRGMVYVRCVLTNFGDETNLTIRIQRRGNDSEIRFVEQSQGGDKNCRWMDITAKKSSQLTFVVVNSFNRVVAQASLTVY